MASDSSSDEDVAKFAAVAVSADALHQQAERSKQASVLGWMRSIPFCRRRCRRRRSCCLPTAAAHCVCCCLRGSPPAQALPNDCLPRLCR